MKLGYICFSVSLLSVVALSLGCKYSNTNADEPVFLELYVNESIDIPLKGLNRNLDNVYSNSRSEYIYSLIREADYSSVVRVNCQNGRWEELCELPKHLSSLSISFSVSWNEKMLLLSNEETVWLMNLNTCNIHDSINVGGIEPAFYFTQISAQFLPMFYDNRIFFHAFANDSNTFRSANFFRQPIEGIVDIDAPDSFWVKGAYPERYTLSSPGYLFAPERLVVEPFVHLYSFNYSDSILLADLRSVKNKFINLGSKQDVSRTLVPFTELEEYDEGVFGEMLMKNHSYSFTYFARHSGYIFRQLFRGMSGAPRAEETSDPKDLNALVVYDLDFNYVGEIPGHFEFSLLKDTPEGLKMLKYANDTLHIKSFEIK